MAIVAVRVLIVVATRRGPTMLLGSGAPAAAGTPQAAGRRPRSSGRNPSRCGDLNQAWSTATGAALIAAQSVSAAARVALGPETPSLPLCAHLSTADP